MPPQQQHTQTAVDYIDEEDGDVVKLVLSSEEEEVERSVSASSHMKSTIALCMCTMTHSWLLISVFPYSGYMAIALIPSANQDNAGSYAGLIASSFMLGRALSSFGWGQMADIYGRTTVLQLSLAMSCIFTLLFGFSRTFVMALLWRFLLGFGNGIIGTAKTAVSELAKGNEKLETRGMGLIMGMWGWGFLICPALSGALAEPVRQYPDIAILQYGWVHSILTEFPFLLPNLAGSLFCISAMVAVALFVKETLDSSQRRSVSFLLLDTLVWLQGLCKGCKTFVLAMRGEHSPFQREGGYHAIDNSDVKDDNSTYNLNEHDHSPCLEISDHDTDDEEDADEALKESALRHTESSLMLCVSPRSTLRKSLAKRRPRSMKALRRWSGASSYSATDNKSVTAEMVTSNATTLTALWSNLSTRNHLLVYWMYSFVYIQVDEAFPLFCISQSGGLGLSEDGIGKVLSGSGIIFAVLQYFIYATVVNRCGLYPSIHIGSFLGAPIIALIPISLFLKVDTSNTLPWSTFIFLSVIMAAYRIFTNIFFSSIAVATNRTVPAAQRGSMNGLSMLGGSIARACGPAFAGFLVTFCLSSGIFPHRVGGALIFIVISLLGVSVAIVSTFLLKEKFTVDRPTRALRR